MFSCGLTSNALLADVSFVEISRLNILNVCKQLEIARHAQGTSFSLYIVGIHSVVIQATINCYFTCYLIVQ